MDRVGIFHPRGVSPPPPTTLFSSHPCPPSKPPFHFSRTPLQFPRQCVFHYQFHPPDPPQPTTPLPLPRALSPVPRLHDTLIRRSPSRERYLSFVRRNEVRVHAENLSQCSTSPLLTLIEYSSSGSEPTRPPQAPPPRPLASFLRQPAPSSSSSSSPCRPPRPGLRFTTPMRPPPKLPGTPTNATSTSAYSN